MLTLPDQIRETPPFDRMISVFASAFAGLATLLAAIGLRRSSRRSRLPGVGRRRCVIYMP
jgi:hypothetical protein